MFHKIVGRLRQVRQSGEPRQSVKRLKIGNNFYLIESDDNYLRNSWGRFEPDLVRLFSSIVKKSDCVIDVGANIGCTSILFGDLAAKVYSFEPSTSTFNFLEKNIGSSGLKNVELINCGLGNACFETELAFSKKNRSGAFISDRVEVASGHVCEQVKINTLDFYADKLKLEKVDFIKIDVEGFEKSVVEGGLNTLKKHKPIVVVELNHWCLNVFQRICVPDFFDFLRGVFPVIFAVDATGVRNLHDISQSYDVMYQHVLRFKYPNIICAFDDHAVAFTKLSKLCNRRAGYPFL